MLNSEEQHFQDLSKSTKIVNSPDSAVENIFNYDLPRIFSFSDSEINKQLGLILVRNIGFSGLKDDQIPEKFMLDDIIKMIKTKFKNLSFGDINLAFDMDRYGEIGEPEKHYYNFDTTFVLSIISKYENWKVEQAKLKSIDPIKKEKEITDEEIQMIDKEYFQSIISDLKEGKSYFDISAECYYERLPSKLVFSDSIIIGSELYKTMLKSYRHRVKSKSDSIKDGILRRGFLTEKKDVEQQMTILMCKNHVTCEFLKFKYITDKKTKK